ncbi:putative zinc binding dehydrogenase [Diaporthe ampelina]|uniref:Putative zinc binding dehydrogenase n=1 Tax=Diaporthe ampelina TaxID=1214573 RepID=A0A0G2FR17_9PEZI|nr:putative zinc binding dehydrogenase [Diaporthe ampelina]
MIQSGIFGTALPITASHEGAGTVVAAGSSADLKPGDRVMCGLPFHPCGKCPDCTGPNEGIDARDDGLQLSEALGADVVIDARKGQEAVVKQVHEATRDANPGDPGVDATVTLSDASTAAALGCAITKKHATMVQIAQPKDVVIPFQEFVFRDIRVKGSVVSSPEESNAMVRFIADAGIKVKTDIFYGLDQIENLVDKVHSGKIQGKAVIVIDKEQISKEEQLGAKY